MDHRRDYKYVHHPRVGVLIMFFAGKRTIYDYDGWFVNNGLSTISMHTGKTILKMDTTIKRVGKLVIGEGRIMVTQAWKGQAEHSCYFALSNRFSCFNGRGSRMQMRVEGVRRARGQLMSKATHSIRLLFIVYSSFAWISEQRNKTSVALKFLWPCIQFHVFSQLLLHLHVVTWLEKFINTLIKRGRHRNPRKNSISLYNRKTLGCLCSVV